MLEYRYESVSPKGGWLEELLRRVLPPASVTEAVANKVGGRFPQWRPLQFAVAFPFFLIMVPDLRAKKRKNQAIKQLLEEDDIVLTHIMNTSQDPEMIYKAGMQRILNQMRAYHASHNS